jgi:beta-lactamase regulating signal transducer with metallopeptidase domain
MVSVPLRQSAGSLSCALGTCNCVQHQQAQVILRNRLSWGLLGIWSIGAGTTGWIAWSRWARFRFMLNRATPAPPEWQALAARLARELSIRLPEVLTVPGRLPPLVVFGRRRTHMLLPKDLLGSLSESQRAAMLLHEMVHIKRGDHLVRLLELTVGVVYWWVPIVGRIGRQLRACEETCCDAAVVARRPEARCEYARLLLDVVEFTSRHSRRAISHATAMNSTAYGLEQRLRQILYGPRSPRVAWPVGLLAVALACVVLPFQLRYDPVGGPTSPTPLAAIELGAPAAPLVGEECDVQNPKLVCCPS